MIPWNPGRVGATVWVVRLQVAKHRGVILIRAICFILPSVCPNFPWYSIYDLCRACPVNGSAANNYFSYAESVRKGVSIFLKFPVGNH